MSALSLLLVRGSVLGADCAACPLAKGGVAHKPVVAEGAADPAWIIVGEGPGATEQRDGRPFVGASGRMVDRVLQMIRVPRDRLWITNATACVPSPNASDATKRRAQQCCAPRLQAELAQFPGKPVLALGSVASQGFLGDKFSITQMAGSLWEHDVDGTGTRHIIPTVHPAAILRGGAGGGGAHSVDLLFVNLVYDASKVARIAEGRQVIFSDDIDIEVEDPVRAEALLREFLGHVRDLRDDMRRLAVDVEAVADAPGRSALEPLHTKLTAIGLATPNWGLSIAWHIMTVRAKRFLGAVLQDSTIPKVMHNRLYDMPALRHAGLTVRGVVDDTLLLHHSAFPGSPHDLQRVATQFFAMPPWKAEYRAMKGGEVALHVIDDEVASEVEVAPEVAPEDMPEVMPGDVGDVEVPVEYDGNLEDYVWPTDDGGADTAKLKKALKNKKKKGPIVVDPLIAAEKMRAELEEHCMYNARDALATARLVQPLRNALRQSKSEMTYDIDIQMAEIAERMHEVGVPISREVNHDLQVRFRDIVARTRAEIEDRVNDPALWPKFVECLCAEQAKRCRKGDSPDYMMRMQKRIVEAGAVHKKTGKLKLEFLIGSGEHVAAYLKARGVNMYMTTEKGKVSTTRDFLETLTSVPEVRDILDYREAAKMLSTFVVAIERHIHDDGRIHPMWSVNKITGRWGAERPQCFDGATEILTEQGWVRFDALAPGVCVAQYTKGDGKIDFVAPTQYVAYPYEGEMVQIQKRHVDLLVTPDHRLLVQTRKGAWHDIEAQAWVEDRRLPTSGQYVGGTTAWSAAFVTLLAAAQADGTWSGSGWDFQFTKQRKVDRLRFALDALAVPYSVRERVVPNPFRPGELRRRVRVYVKASAPAALVQDLLGATKSFGPWLLTLTAATLQLFADELMFWDGSQRNNCYATSNRNNADWAQITYALTNRRARLRAYTGSKLQTKTNWQLDVVERVNVSTTHAQVTRVPWNAPVYCVSVPSSYIVVRRGMNVMITGQCQNWPKANKKKNRPNLRAQVVAPPGRKLVGADFAQLEARIIALLSGDPFLVGIFADHKDIHSEFARLVWPNFDTIEPTERKELRDMIKRPEYGSFYGGDPTTLHAAVVKDYPQVTLSQIRNMVKIMQARMPGVTRWHQQLIQQVNTSNEIRSAIYGRRRTFPLGNAEPTDTYNFGVQCLTGDQHVLTTMGWVPIAAIDPAVHQLVRQGEAPTSNYKLHRTGKKTVFRLKTQSRELIASARHNFLAHAFADQVEWRTLEELAAGDWIAIDEGDSQGVSTLDAVAPVDVDERVAEVIGALFGNGHYAGRGCCIATGSAGYATYLSALLQATMPKANVKIRTARDRTIQVVADGAVVQAYLTQWGLPIASKRRKRLPAWAETATRDLRLAMLRGLFDTDGGFTTRHVVYTTAVKEAAFTIHRLLLSVGVDTRVRTYRQLTPHGDLRRYWRVFVQPWAMPAFTELVGFRHPDRALMLRTRKPLDARRALPPILTAFVGTALHSRCVGVPRSALQHAQAHRFRAGSASREQLLRYLSMLSTRGVPVADLQATVTTHRFDQILSIRKLSERETFDIEILDGDHTYNAEGIVVHNSTAADIMDTGLLRLVRNIDDVDPSAEVVLQIHDALVVECAEDRAEAVCALVTECLSQEHHHNGVTVQFPAEAAIGDDWTEV